MYYIGAFSFLFYCHYQQWNITVQCKQKESRWAYTYSTVMHNTETQ